MSPRVLHPVNILEEDRQEDEPVGYTTAHRRRCTKAPREMGDESV